VVLLEWVHTLRDAPLEGTRGDALGGSREFPPPRSPTDRARGVARGGVEDDGVQTPSNAVLPILY